jgi:hypothetical protein
MRKSTVTKFYTREATMRPLIILLGCRDTIAGAAGTEHLSLDLSTSRPLDLSTKEHRLEADVPFKHCVLYFIFLLASRRIAFSSAVRF